uniref:Uncharacterized protein n=1 Tax=Oryza sativa subsp. japonica TaxID=39947 RepID=Q69U76_ORYSJ|nr:hypothetical protein [Oryza sativa Japonica Group]
MVLLEPLVAGGVVLQEFSVETATALPELSATMAVTPSSTSVVVESLGSSQRCARALSSSAAYHECEFRILKSAFRWNDTADIAGDAAIVEFLALSWKE